MNWPLSVAACEASVLAFCLGRLQEEAFKSGSEELRRWLNEEPCRHGFGTLGPHINICVQWPMPATSVLGGQRWEGI